VTAIPTSSPVPWRPADATRLVLVDIVGGSAVVVGWLGTAQTSALSRQLTWVTVAVVGLVIAGTGNALWLLAGRRNVGLRLRAALDEHVTGPAAVPVPGVVAHPAARALVAVPRGSRYHRPACVLARGKEHQPATAKRHLANGLRPCEACRPEVDE
jgi:hypothetical protein